MNLSKIPELAGVPELSFTENLTLQEAVEQAKTIYDTYYKEMTGSDAKYSQADPVALILDAMGYLYYQILQYIEVKGDSEMLPTATGNALEQLAALFGLNRHAAQRATARVRFTLSAEQPGAVAVPAGTRVRTESGIYFNTTDYAEIPAGQTAIDVAVVAETAGADADGIAPGKINQLVDPIAYVASVENVSASSGGTEPESDDALTQRVYLAPSIYSCAGPLDAYAYFAKNWRNDVADVKITNPSDCVVRVYFMLEGGKLPSAAELQEMENYLRDERLRPMCDKVEALAPEETVYNIGFTYYIAASDKRNAAAIQAAVAEAVETYQAWQRTLGRDVNPDELRKLVRMAGAKRMIMTAPAFAPIPETGIAKLGSCAVTYGGIEDD